MTSWLGMKMVCWWRQQRLDASFKINWDTAEEVCGKVILVFHTKITSQCKSLFFFFLNNRYSSLCLNFFLFFLKIFLILVIWSFGKCKSWDPKDAAWKRALWRFHEESFHEGCMCIKSWSHDYISKQRWYRLVFCLRFSAYFQKGFKEISVIGVVCSTNFLQYLCLIQALLFLISWCYIQF